MIMEKLIHQFPGGMFFRYLKGKELQFTGELNQSCKMFSCGTGDWETFKVSKSSADISSLNALIENNKNFNFYFSMVAIGNFIGAMVLLVTGKQLLNQ